MKLLVIVNESPWGGSLAVAALRFVRAARSLGHSVPAVFFRGDGVYHAVAGRMADGGQDTPAAAWVALATPDTRLLVCSADAARRLDAGFGVSTGSVFEEAGLARMWRLAADCDRVVAF